MIWRTTFKKSSQIKIQITESGISRARNKCHGLNLRKKSRKKVVSKRESTLFLPLNIRLRQNVRYGVCWAGIEKKSILIQNHFYSNNSVIFAHKLNNLTIWEQTRKITKVLRKSIC